MTLDVFALARQGGCVEGEFDVAQLQRLASMLVPPLGRIRYRLQGRIDAHGRPAAVLRIQLDTHVNCDRCGEPMPLQLDETGEFFFLEEERELNALPIDADAVNEPLLGSRHFDVRDLIEDQAILALPISPRHPGCGGGDTDEPESEVTHRPFAVLAAHKRRTDIQ